jgi:hypothetical protein
MKAPCVQYFLRLNDGDCTGVRAADRAWHVSWTHASLRGSPQRAQPQHLRALSHWCDGGV